MFNTRLVYLLIFYFLSAGSLYPAEENVKNRIIYIIHGDGDYLYHDIKTGERISDEVVLHQALENAREGTSSEYFIFHLKPKRSFLIFFPGEESGFYHYKKGQLITESKYFRYEPVEGHSAESYLLKSANAAKSADVNILLYYGHEIPLEEEYGYNASFPEVPLGLKSFTGKVNELLITLEEMKFDLLVISTCNNGSPQFIFALADLADFIIASPGDLHLSQMNSSALQFLEKEDITVNALALRFASEAFNLLSIKTFTEVVISVYNAQELLNSNYNFNDICAGGTEIDRAVRVFHRPAKFGKYKNRIAHTGWHCKDQEGISRNIE